MKNSRFSRIAAAMVVTLTSLTLAGTLPASVALAQTPIPLAPETTPPPTIEPSATIEPTAVPTEAVPADAQPASTEDIVWTPSTGNLSMDGSNSVKVRISSNEGDLNSSTAKFQLIVSGVFQPEQNATATAVSGNTTFDLSANVSGASSGSQILFKINKVGGGQVQSNIFTITRSTKLGLPITHRDAGNSTISTSILNAGGNACDASTNRKGGPLGSFVSYQATGTTTDMWFYTYNPNAGATLAVSLTNYASVSGQLQVYPASACGGTPAALGFAANPNPVVNVVNAPAGIIYFRVVSAGGQGAPAPFIIRWALGTQSVSSGSEIEPNNNICQATPLPERAVFTALDNDQYDYYSIVMTTTTQVVVFVEGYPQANAQVQVRVQASNEGCPFLIPADKRKDPYVEPIGYVSTAGANVLTRVGVVFNPGSNGDQAGTPSSPQTFYIRVSNPGTGVTGSGYKIRWVSLLPGYVTYPFTDRLNTTTPVFSTSPFVTQGNQTNSGNVREKWFLTTWWANMDKLASGFDTIQYSLESLTLDGCPSNVFPPDTGRTVPSGFGGGWKTVSNAASGAFTLKMNKSGGYKLRFRVLKNGTQVFGDEKPIRVDCGFTTYNYGGVWPFGASVTADPDARPEKKIEIVPHE